MKQKLLQKTLLLLFALIAGSTSVWADDKPWSGDDPATTLDLKTITSSTMGTWQDAKSWYLDDEYLVVSGYASYKSVANQTWITQASAGNSGSTWDESAPFKGSSYYTTASYTTIQGGRYLLYKVTNLKSLKVYGKNNATTKYLDIFIYTKSGDVYNKVEEIKYTTDNNVHIWENSEDLDPDETYYIYITAVGSSNSRVFEVAFERNVEIDTRADAGLAYAVAAQSISIGDVLDAPTLTNPNGLAVTYESADEAIATVDSEGNVTGVAKGTTTITASFAGNSTYKPGEASYTITVIKVAAYNSVWYESFDTNASTGGNDGIWSGISVTPAPMFDLTGWTYDTAYGASECVRIGKGGYFTSPALGVAGDVTLTFKMESWGSDTGKGYVAIIGDGTFEDETTQAEVSLNKNGTWKEFSLKLIGVTAETKVKFFHTSTDKRLFIDEVEVFLDKVPVTITTADYATFCSAVDLDFSATGITVYEAEVESNKVKFTEVSDGLVKAGEGVLLYKDVDAETVVNVPVTTGVAALSENELVGVTAETAVAYNPTSGVYNYILQMDGANLVFRKATGAKLRANRAYLSTDYDVTAPGARELEVSFGDETAINALENSNKVNDGAIYDLSGRRVENPTKGIYIMNGKKVIFK